MSCPCHSGEEYEKCCKPYHEGAAPPTPEKLMRSRYSAYALSLADYILKTQRERAEKSDIEAFCKVTDFKDLKILKVEPTHVTFHATLFQGDHDVSFTERSLFEEKEGFWTYVKKTPLP